MIPYAILSGELYFLSQASPLEIRMLELSPDYFTIRLSKKYKDKMQDLRKIHLFFFQYGNQNHQKVILEDFRVTLLESEKFYSIYRVEPGSVAGFEYADAVTRLSKEYLNYIEAKLYDSDVELMASYTSYPADLDHIFAKDEKEQISLWVNEINDSFDKNILQPKDFHEDIMKNQKSVHEEREDSRFSLLLDHPDRYQAYLTKDGKEYARDYWKALDLSRHPASLRVLEGIHIGNAFCIHLLPEVSMLKELIKKADREDLEVVFLLPPISQSDYAYAEKYLNSLHDFLKEQNLSITIEINDIGMKKAISEKGWKEIELVSGILMQKHSKDGRWRYRNKTQKDAISSWMDCVDYSDISLYIPLCQTNTGTFCPLYSIHRYHDRAKASRVHHCGKECLEANLLYPTHLKMTGRFNSLFYCNVESMLYENKRYKRKWVVYNL